MYSLRDARKGCQHQWSTHSDPSQALHDRCKSTLALNALESKVGSSALHPVALPHLRFKLICQSLKAAMPGFLMTKATCSVSDQVSVMSMAEPEVHNSTSGSCLARQHAAPADSIKPSTDAEHAALLPLSVAPFRNVLPPCSTCDADHAHARQPDAWPQAYPLHFPPPAALQPSQTQLTQVPFVEDGIQRDTQSAEPAPGACLAVARGVRRQPATAAPLLQALSALQSRSLPGAGPAQPPSR